MMRRAVARLALLTFAAALFAMLAGPTTLRASHTAADDVSVATLAHGEFALADTREPPTQVSWEMVALPDDWERTRPKVSGVGWYRMRWNLADVSQRTYAVYLTATTVHARVFVNGAFVGATGDFDAPPPRSFDQSQAFDVPVKLLRPGLNEVAVQVAARAPDVAALDVVLIGAEPPIRTRAQRDLLVHTVLPGIISVTITVVGFFILALWVRRHDRSYAMFGVASVLWGLHTAVTLLPWQVLPSPHYGILWHGVYMAFVVLLSLFCADFAGFRRRSFRRFAVGYAIAVVPILYAALALGVAGSTAVAVRAGGIAIVLVALLGVLRYALLTRSSESLLLLFTGTVAAVFAVHDWIASQDPALVRPVWLVPYSALMFLTLFAWILIDRFVRALNESERLNAVLEQRVAEKSAALAGQLASTEDARRQAEAARAEAEAARGRAEAADRAKSHFLAAASHDLRQPLHALGLFAAALSERAHDAQTATLAQRINTSVASLETLFSALLDVSKLDAGAVTAQPRDVELDPLLERLANDFTPEAVEKQLDLLVLPTRASVHTDPVLLERILRNLVANAIRYTATGGVLVGCRRRGGELSIEVWDTGPGIELSEQARIFDEFYQIGNPERDRTRGLGLGLAIVRRLVDLLGHRVEVASRPGRGSVFRVIVPPGRRRPAVHDTPAIPAAAPLAGRRVLVIDDEFSVRDGMCRVLQAWGCDSEAYGSPDEVPDDAAVPDLVVVDYRLRGLDGLAAVERLRARFGAGLPAVIVSGESSGDELARLAASGIPLLHKPVPPAKLRSVLLYALSPALAH